MHAVFLPKEPTWHLATVLLLVFASVMVATVLCALAAPLEQRAGRSRRLAFAVATLLVAIALPAAAWLIGDRLAAQLGDLRQQLPKGPEQLARSPSRAV